MAHAEITLLTSIVGQVVTRVAQHSMRNVRLSSSDVQTVATVTRDMLVMTTTNAFQLRNVTNVPRGRSASALRQRNLKVCLRTDTVLIHPNIFLKNKIF